MITFLAYCIDKINQRHSGSSFILLRALTWHNGGLNLTLSMALIICTPTVTLADVPLKRGFTERSFILLWPGQSSDDAQLDLDAPLVTDRPNFTDAASTVGRGVSQIEFGYTYFYSEAYPGKGSAHTYPEAAFRYGALRDWIELRLRQSLITQDISGDSSTSLGNTYLGTKLGLLPQYGLLPQVSVQPQMTLPTGSGDSRTEHILPGINTLFFWTLADKTFLTGSSQVNRSDTKDVSDINTIWAHSAVIGTQVDKRLSCFIEWYGIFRRSAPNNPDLHFADTGLMWLFDNNTQLDIRFGSRLQDRFGEELFAGFGMSLRFL